MLADCLNCSGQVYITYNYKIQIERCPYFLCLMGHRYGWCQKSDTNDEGLTRSFDYAVENCPSLKWINDFRFDTSVTKVKIIDIILDNISYPSYFNILLFSFMNNSHIHWHSLFKVEDWPRNPLLVIMFV